ncbi:WecB/TagA/CpsF family glycosyltransferase [Lactococcus lactis]|uniref:Glycosyltransferase n=1 Tax=Lactococcus lactis TaxID=1358 RepID=A0A3Q9TDY7_9LACT|nr:WecB/TagA/CpsF family glycosyltransferase [Lactococcus lactis]AZY91814.1 glycosyltransferase [Lactococcus lactis]MDM7498891.1 WecB/TagA/CpsF family glycosyltransferase [Lactococcus lactis]
MTRMKFMNTEVDSLNMPEVLDRIDKLIQIKKNSYVVTPNVDHIVQLEKDSELQKVYKNADLILADGKPLIWISNYYKTPIKEKVSGSDLFPLLCEMAGKKGYKMFFLGAAKGVAARAATNLKKRYSNLEVAGVYSPPFGFEENEEEVEKILQMIIKSNVDILIVGLGAPKQEKFIFKYHDRLNVPISLGLGASLDFEAGNIKRAPKWMQRSGLEWFFRITQDPRRMFKRYIIDDLKIIRLVRKYKIKNEA